MENELQKTTQDHQSKAFITKFVLAVGSQNSLEINSMSRKVGMPEATNGISLRKLAKNLGEDDLALILSSMIQSTASFLNIGNNMSEGQEIETAYLLLEKYPTESLEDFIILFKDIKTGKYGELYNRFDGQQIFGFMEKHLDRKAQFRENQHKQIKAQVPQESLQALIEEKGPTKPILDALKTAIEFDPDLERKEKEYAEFRKHFIKSQVTKNNIENNEIK